jgi:hypothetical protein
MSIKVITSIYKDEHKLNKWIDKIKKANVDYIVYKKNDNLKIGEKKILTDNLVEIPNKGRCDYAFLCHIIDNYDNLARTNVFVKCNWYENNIPFWDLLLNCHNYDYMQVGTHYEVIDWDELDIESGLCERKQKWLSEIFPDNTKLGKVAVWGHGPSFSVSRELIHRHKKEVYENMLNKFHEDSGSFSLDYEKYNYRTYNDMYVDVGITYHNDLLRFYRILFTHDLPKDNKYKILTHEESMKFNKKEKPKKIKMNFM